MTAIDLGSNTIRFVTLNCTTGEETASGEAVVRTAEGMHDSGVISEAALERITTAILSWNLAGDPVAVATAAFRHANNQTESLTFIREKTGVDFQVISPETEARLTALAVFKRVQLHGLPTPILMLDIGGASTELAWFDGTTLRAESFSFGIVTAAEKHPTSSQLHTWLNQVTESFAAFAATLPQAPTFAATAGTPTTIAALKKGMDYTTYDKQKINGSELTISDIQIWHEKLLAASQKEREKMVGVRRDDLILAGTQIQIRLMEILQKEACIVVDDGLREGVALAACTGETLF